MRGAQARTFGVWLKFGPLLSRDPSCACSRGASPFLSAHGQLGVRRWPGLRGRPRSQKRAVRAAEAPNKTPRVRSRGPTAAFDCRPVTGGARNPCRARGGSDDIILPLRHPLHSRTTPTILFFGLATSPRRGRGAPPGSRHPAGLTFESFLLEGPAPFETWFGGSAVVGRFQRPLTIHVIHLGGAPQNTGQAQNTLNTQRWLCGRRTGTDLPIRYFGCNLGLSVQGFQSWPTGRSLPPR